MVDSPAQHGALNETAQPATLQHWRTSSGRGHNNSSGSSTGRGSYTVLRRRSNANYCSTAECCRAHVRQKVEHEVIGKDNCSSSSSSSSKH